MQRFATILHQPKKCCMSLKTLLLALLLLPGYTILAQPPVISLQWKKSFGGTDFESSQKIRSTADGGYIVVGITFSTDGHITINKGICDVWLVKLNANGTMAWQRTYGGSNDDGAYDVQQTSDGGYVMAGYTKSNDGDVTGFRGAIDCWIIKTDANGNVQWQRSMGGTEQEVATAIRQTPDGGYVFTGYTFSANGDVSQHRDNNNKQDYWLVKLDAAGNKIWDKCYGGPDHDFPNDIAITADGGFAVTGYTLQNGLDVTGHKGKRDIWVILTNITGTLLWQRSVGGTEFDISHSITTTNNGFIISGHTASANGDMQQNKGQTDAVLVQLATDGTVQWVKTYGGSALDVFRQVIPTTDGYLAIGSAESNDHDVTGAKGSSDFWLVKTTTAGNIEWTKNFGGSGIDDAVTVCVKGNDIAFAGTSFSTDHDVLDGIGAGDWWIASVQVQKVLPVIVTQPADTLTLCKGATATYSIHANNTTSYQWQARLNGVWVNINDGIDYSGTATQALQVLDAGSSANMFRCVVSNANGSVESSVGVLNVNTAPVVAAKQLAINSCTNSNIVLTADISSAIPVTYQWQSSGNNTTWQNVQLGNNASLQFVTANVQQVMWYRLIATNVCGSATGTATKVTTINCNIPTAFSPNGDNVNDTWRISMPSLFKIQLFDRYGASIYNGQHNGSFAWSGTINGKQLPVGVYYYMVSADGYKPFTGAVSLLK
jgi:gliding motility-associated-like protein